MTKPAPAAAPLILLTGFLGAGKTTFLQNLVTELLRRNFVPRVVLNDYENADVDAIAVRRLTARLDACLLTDAEMKLGEEGWQKFPDPFLEWRVAEAAPENSPTEIRA